MNASTTALATLLRWMAVLLPPERRNWVEALLGEAADVPGGRARVSWLVGGLWLVIRESGVIRRIAYTVAGVAAGATFAWLNRHPGSADPGASISRVMNVLEFLVPVLMPWVARPLLGPVAITRTARAVRSGGYVGIYALMLVIVGVSRYAGSRFDGSNHGGMTVAELANWTDDRRSGAVFGGLLIMAILGGYAFILLALTSRRWAVPSGTLILGTSCGVLAALFVYALTPLGSPLHAHNWAAVAAIYAGIFLVPPGTFITVGKLAGRRSATAVATAHRVPVEDTVPVVRQLRAKEGIAAGLLAGSVCALLLTIATITTMLLFPHNIALKWANPDRNAPHGTTYEWQMSLGDSAQKYELGLVLGPLAGIIFGFIGGDDGPGEPTGAPPTRRRPEEEGELSVT